MTECVPLRDNLLWFIAPATFCALLIDEFDRRGGFRDRDHCCPVARPNKVWGQSIMNWKKVTSSSIDVSQVRLNLRQRQSS